MLSNTSDRWAVEQYPDDRIALKQLQDLTNVISRVPWLARIDKGALAKWEVRL